jgi:uncharacterized damage-inducible protein DinB
MRDDFVSLYAYDRWANEKILDACRRLSAEQFTTEPVPGWSSVRASLTHVAIVTDGWLRGLAGENVQVVPTEADLPTVDDAATLFGRAYDRLDALLQTLSATDLATPREFRGARGSAVLPPWAVLRHIVNHSTYHRGQIAAKFKRLGFDAPATDLVFWVMAQADTTT